MDQTNRAVVEIRRVEAELAERLERVGDDENADRGCERLRMALDEVEGDIYQERNPSKHDHYTGKKVVMKESSSSVKSVIVGVAVLVIAEVVLRWGLSSSTVDVLKWLWSAAIRHYSVRGWFVGLIAAGPLLFGYVMMKLGGNSSMIDVHQDQLYGMTWRWELRNGTIYRLSCFCPACDNELIDINVVYYGRSPSYTFSCDHCNEVVGEVETIKGEAPSDRVKREIRRRYRTGEFKQQLKDGRMEVS